MDVFAQPGHGIRLEWSGEGVAALGEECAVLIIVDVLSFSTTVDIATERGSRVLPLRWRDERASEEAIRAGAVLAGSREWNLSPFSVLSIPADTLFALPSPNGATLAAAADEAGAHVFAGCLRNADAVTAAARQTAPNGPFGVIPAGERWRLNLHSEATDIGGPLRPSVEDLLGAGAIVDALLTAGVQSPSAEATLAARAFRAGGADVRSVIAGSASGKELAQAGNGRDIDLATALNASSAAPYLHNGTFKDVTVR